MEEKIDYSFLDEGYGHKRKQKEPSHLDIILETFNQYYGEFSKEIEPFSVSSLIGNGGSRLLGNDESWKAEWMYIPKNGEHKKSNGQINFIEYSSNPEKALARLDVNKGKAYKLTLKSIRFISEMDNHKNLVLYSNIKEALTTKSK